MHLSWIHLMILIMYVTLYRRSFISGPCSTGGLYVPISWTSRLFLISRWFYKYLTLYQSLFITVYCSTTLYVIISWNSRFFSLSWLCYCCWFGCCHTSIFGCCVFCTLLCFLVLMPKKEKRVQFLCIFFNLFVQ